MTCRSAEEMGISKSAVSRHFVNDSAQALAKLIARSFEEVNLLAIYVDGIIVAKHHIIAAVGVDAIGEPSSVNLALPPSACTGLPWSRRYTCIAPAVATSSISR